MDRSIFDSPSTLQREAELLRTVMSQHRRYTNLLLTCIAGYTLLTLTWNIATPPYESPDEPAHVEYAKFLAEHGRLPNLTTDDAGYEAHQPPLYYVLLAVILRAAGNPDINVRPVENPHSFRHGGPLASRQFQPLPRQQAEWIHRLRAVSLLPGLVTLLAIYMSAHQLTQSSRIALVAASHAAFLPQFTFISASVNNDTLVTALTSLSFLVLVRIATTPNPPTRNYALLALLIALAALTKLNALFMLPLSAAVVAWKSRSPRTVARNMAILMMFFLAVSGWYFLLNWLRYGDILGAEVQKSLVHSLVHEKRLFSHYFVSDFPKSLFKSFFGLFGSMNIHLAESLYWIYGLIWLLSIAGLISSATDRLHSKGLAWIVVLGAILSSLAAVVYYNLIFTQAQGRLLFPALAPISILLASGLDSVSQYLRRSAAGPSSILFVVGVNLYSLWFVIRIYSH